MWRHERHRHRVQPPDEHGPAVREVVGRRARRRRADDAVAGTAPSSRHRSATRAPPCGRASRSSTTTSLTATWRSPPSLDLERGSSTHHVLAREHTFEACFELVAAIDVRKPTRPKLTPTTGTPVPRQRCERAQHRPVAAQHDRRRRAAPTRSADDARRRTPPRPRPIRATASPITSGLPCVTTPARRTGSADCSFDPGIELIREARAVRRGELEEELPVSLRAGQPRVYDAGDASRSHSSAASATSRSTRACTSRSRMTPPLALLRAPPRIGA